MISTYYLFYPIMDSITENNSQFIIHEHHSEGQAGLHYDLRIEKDGVLKSWATKKIPQLINGELKRIQLFPTPDHDFDKWINFKGRIDDDYGRGDVIIWDKGYVDIIKWKEPNTVVNFKGKKIKGNYSIIPYVNNSYLMVKMKRGG